MIRIASLLLQSLSTTCKLSPASHSPWPFQFTNSGKNWSQRVCRMFQTRALQTLAQGSEPVFELIHSSDEQTLLFCRVATCLSPYSGDRDTLTSCVSSYVLLSLSRNISWPQNALYCGKKVILVAFLPLQAILELGEAVVGCVLPCWASESPPEVTGAQLQYLSEGLDAASSGQCGSRVSAQTQIHRLIFCRQSGCTCNLL